jgi:hypothetical protein
MNRWCFCDSTSNIKAPIPPPISQGNTFIMHTEFLDEANEKFHPTVEQIISLAILRALNDTNKERYSNAFAQNSYTVRELRDANGHRFYPSCGKNLFHSTRPLNHEHFDIPKISFVVPLPGRLAECTWSKRDRVTDNTVYINPDLLGRYKSTGHERCQRSLLCLIYCIVLNEFSHLLKLRAENNPPAMKPDHHLEIWSVGGEAQAELWGGHIYSRFPFCEFRIQTPTGEIYDLDPDYFYERITGPTAGVELEFDKLCKRKMKKGMTLRSLSWMSLDEINGTHEMRKRRR